MIDSAKIDLTENRDFRKIKKLDRFIPIVQGDTPWERQIIGRPLPYEQSKTFPTGNYEERKYYKERDTQCWCCGVELTVFDTGELCNKCDTYYAKKYKKIWWMEKENYTLPRCFNY